MNIINKNNTSTWMLVAAMIIIGTMSRPNLLTFLMIPLVGCWLFAVREIARRESARPMCKMCVATAICISVGAIFLMTKINWLAL